MDDMARDYLAMGVIAEEDIGDIKKCLHCRASVMPWQLRCEECGSSSPFTPKPPLLWTCCFCGMSDYESERDAEACCSANES